MAAAIGAETNGRLQIKVFANSVLGSQTSMMGQLRIGSIQFLIANHSLFASLVPAAQISSVGFAFTSDKVPLDALDGALGAYVRRELGAKGLHVFEKTVATGFRQVTSATKPIRTADDLANLRIRVIAAPIFVDLFKTLGASPVPLDSNELYVSLQTRLVDGQENGLPGIEGFRVYEVQRYLSLTNHIWSGEWLTANVDSWNALPSDIQTIVNRNAQKYILLERRDATELNASLLDKLHRQGLAVNTADAASMRARLAPYYARWKNEFGATAWGLLEESAGKLG